MKYVLMVLFICLFVTKTAYGEQENNYSDHFRIQKENEVVIAPNCIAVPLERILLVHKDSTYCAIKFLRSGLVNAEYVAYYQPDKTGNFEKENVEIKNGELLSKEPVGIGRFAFSFGQKLDIECGPLELRWSGRRWVCFYSSTQDNSRDHGIDLAPTPWTDITQVNVFDPRVKWYRYDEKRKKVFIPIDKLWPETDPPAKSDPAKP